MTHSCPTRRSSDLLDRGAQRLACLLPARLRVAGHVADAGAGAVTVRIQACVTSPRLLDVERQALGLLQQAPAVRQRGARSEEHTSELQSLMRISYAVFCLKKKNKHNQKSN